MFVNKHTKKKRKKIEHVQKYATFFKKYELREPYTTNSRIMWIKADLHSANVSRSTDAILWRLFFFSVSL